MPIKVAIRQKQAPDRVADADPKIDCYNLDIDRTIDTIYHISDIHIRPLRRHDEFREVFSHVEQAIAGSGETAIMVITGDIFDNKTIFRPETFKLCRELFKMITRHLPLVVIAGNHDMMEGNSDRLDAITPVIDDIPNLHYLKYTGLYTCQPAGICFVVSSLYDRQFIRHQHIVDSEHYDARLQYIALYHGTLSGAKTDGGYTADDPDDGGDRTVGRFRSVSDFDGYNATLLGDIHKHQILRTSPPIAYAGSLIQQNHGESRDGHGILVWKCNAGSWGCYLSPIHNDSGFVDIYCQDGIWTNHNVELPPKCHARLVIRNCTETQLDVILSTVRRKAKEFTVAKRQCISDNVDDFEVQPDIQRKEDEIGLIRDQATLLQYDPEQLIKLHIKYQAEMEIETPTMATAIWRPIILEFRNMFGFGNGTTNKIIFRKGIISICARNFSGKTSIVNVLLFALFGKTPLNPAGATTSYTYDIVNNAQTSGYVTLLVNYGGIYYLIERKSVRLNNKGVATQALKHLNRYDFTCSIWESNIRGERLKNCSESRGNNNDTFIRELFGDIGDFTLSNLLNKESSSDLMSMPPAEQIRQLKRLFKMDIYDQYRDNNKTRLAEMEQTIAELRLGRSAIAPMIDHTVSQQSLDDMMQTARALRDEIAEYREVLQLLQGDREEFTTAFNNCKAQILDTEHVLDMDKDTIEAELDHIPISASTGQSAETLSYIVSGLRSRLSDITDELSRQNRSLTGTREELTLELESLSGWLQLPEERGLSAFNINRNIGKLHQRLDTMAESPVLAEGACPPQETVAELRSRLTPLTSDLTQIQRRLDQLTVDMQGVGADDADDSYDDADDSYGSDADGADADAEILNIRSELASLQAECQLLDSIRNRTYRGRGESLEAMEARKVPGLPSIKYNVSEADLDNVMSKLSDTRGQLLLLAGKSATDLIGYLESDMDITQPIINDIISHLRYGDKIRQLEVQTNTLETRGCRLSEQIETNRQIADNSVLDGKIAQLKYLDNQARTDTLRDRLVWLEAKLQRDATRREYQNLCAEEERHYTNSNLYELIAQRQAYDLAERHNIERAELLSRLSVEEGKLRYIEASAELDRIIRIDELEAQVGSLQSEISVNEGLLTQQQYYDRSTYLQECLQQFDIISANREHLETMASISSDLVDIESDISQQEQVIRDAEAKLRTIEDGLGILSYRVAEQIRLSGRLAEVESKLVELETEIIPYQNYNVIMGNKGITSKLLYNKIKAIEDYINTIIQQFTKYRVLIIYEEAKQSISILTVSDGKYLSTSRLSGYEKLMLQLAFKRALNKYSYNSKSSLIIIDEGADVSDEDNFLTKIPDVLNLISQDYSHCLMISQRDMRHISDSTITISTQDGYSRIL